MYRLLLFLVAGLLLAGCARFGPEPPAVHYNPPAEAIIPALIAGDPTRWPQDRLEFGEMSIDGDTLIADVTYAGGCREHGFALVFSNGFLESEPVQVTGLVSHDSQRDLCRALVGRTLRFDLAPLRDAYRQAYRTQSGTIVLTGNWPQALRYRF
jgi:hypothetical protein